jgi:hypothetical protein
METDPVSKRCAFQYLEFQTMDKAQTTQSSHSHTPLSKLFRLFSFQTNVANLNDA